VFSLLYSYISNCRDLSKIAEQIHDASGRLPNRTHIVVVKLKMNCRLSTSMHTNTEIHLSTSKRWQAHDERREKKTRTVLCQFT